MQKHRLCLWHLVKIIFLGSEGAEHKETSGEWGGNEQLRKAEKRYI